MRIRAALLCAAVVFTASSSHANGRFPLSQRLLQDQGNPDHIVLSATFGMLITHDRGQNWYHVCEGVLTSEILDSDILFELVPDGSMLAALVRPLKRSSDCGCTWEPVLGGEPNTSITDIAKAGSNQVLALHRATVPTLSFTVERSNDSGRTWISLSELPPGLEAFTLDVAPSDPMRVYVSVMLSEDPDAGIASATPALLVSEDGGSTWSAPKPIHGAIPFDDQPFIAAVHPTDAETVFVRTYNWTTNDETGLSDANDALFVTNDGGAQFREVLRKGAKLFGFALSPDASTVVVGYGDPQQATRNVYPEDVGIYRASTADFAFTLALNEPVSCLTWNGNGLYACFNDSVGVSADGSVPTTIAGFTEILANENVLGPLACNATTCLPEWQMGTEDVASVCDRLRAECNVDPAGHVLTCSGPTGGAGGMGAGGSGASAGAANGGATSGGSGAMAGMGAVTTGGASTSGGAGGSMRPRGGAAGVPAGNDDDDDSGSSCGCRSPRPTHGAGPGVTLALLALLFLRRRAAARHSG